MASVDMAEINDFVTTSQEKYQAGESLIATEKTDAINSGIVDGSSKQSHLKSRNTNVIKDRQDVNSSDGYNHVSYKKNSEQIVPETGISQKFSNKKLILAKGVEKYVHQSMRDGVHKFLENTDLEGVDDAYYRGKQVYNTPRKINQIVSTCKKFNERRAAVKKAILSIREQQKQAQGRRYFTRKVYNRAAAAKTKTSLSLLGKASVVVSKSFFGKIALIAAIPLLFIGIFFSLILIPVLFSSDVKDETFDSINEVQTEVARALHKAGLENIQIAAIMGNISGESGWNPEAEYHGQGNPAYSYEYGYGLFQFTDTKQGVGNYTNYKNWVEANGKELNSASAQTEYFISQLPTSWATGLHESGYYTSYLPKFRMTDISYSQWLKLKEKDLDLATYAFLACYERPADWAAKNSFPTRFAEASRFYNVLSKNKNALLFSEQQSIINAAKNTDSPGMNLCAMWVSDVYEKAGFGRIGGNANDMYRNFANNSDPSQLKEGMVVAVESSSSGGIAGAIYGHVGIYIGEGKVMHNVGTIKTISLDDWISLFGKNSPVGWGYPPNVNVP